MSNLVVHTVSSRQQRKQFLNLPWSIYRDDPNWVPPLRQNQAELVGYKHHPFYDDADAETFLAVRDGVVCGRLMALVNHAHNRRFNEKTGMFGFFESVDDSEVAARLFDAAKAWLCGQGMTRARGPMNPSMNYECGLLVDGFDSPPTFMMTYNRPYYGRLIEENGFETSQDMFAFEGHVDMLEGLDKKLQFVVDEATRRFDISLRRMEMKGSGFKRDVRIFLDIYNQSLGGTWGFVPLSESEIEQLAAGLKHLLVPEMTSIAEIDGKPIGAVVGLLDFNPLIKKIDGRLFPFGFLKLMTGKRKLKRVRLMATNVVPEFQKWGVGLVVLDRLVPDILKWGVEEAEFSWVLESNHLSRKSLERGGAILAKTYRMYDCELDNE